MTRAALSQAGSPGQWIPRSWISGPHPTDLLLTAAIVLLGLPQSVLEKAYVGEVPLVYILQYAAGAGIVVETIAYRRGQGTSWWPTAVLLLGVYMGIAGVQSGAEVKWWVIDATMYGGFLLGIAWRQQRSAESAARTIQLWAPSPPPCWRSTSLGLTTGLIDPVADTDRTYSKALFNTAGFVAVVFPYWLVTLRRGNAGLSGARPRRAGLPGHRHRLRRRVHLRHALALDRRRHEHPLRVLGRGQRPALGHCGRGPRLAGAPGRHETEAFATVAGSLLAERLSDTAMTDEARYVEVEMLYDDLTSDGGAGGAAASAAVSP